MKFQQTDTTASDKLWRVVSMVHFTVTLCLCLATGYLLLELKDLKTSLNTQLQVKRAGVNTDNLVTKNTSIVTHTHQHSQVRDTLTTSAYYALSV